MKGIIVTVCLLYFLLLTQSFASCGAPACRSQQQYSEASSCSSSEDETCQCTDPGCFDRSNDCLSKSRCCEAFGNVGGR